MAAALASATRIRSKFSILNYEIFLVAQKVIGFGICSSTHYNFSPAFGISSFFFLNSLPLLCTAQRVNYTIAAKNRMQKSIIKSRRICIFDFCNWQMGSDKFIGMRTFAGTKYQFRVTMREVRRVQGCILLRFHRHIPIFVHRPHLNTNAVNFLLYDHLMTIHFLLRSNRNNKEKKCADSCQPDQNTRR